MDALDMEMLLNGGPLVWTLVFLAGLLSVFTPCVLPMVPITMRSLGTHSKPGRLYAFGRSLSYALGIVTMFTVMGTISALTGSAFGSVMGHPVVAAALASVLIAFACASFGLFELRMPSFIANRLVGLNGSSFFGTVLLGMFVGVFAMPCVGPVLFGILTAVATTKDAAFGAGLLATYAAGFSLPFVIVGTFSVHLPKGGVWLRKVNDVLGIGLLLTAFWFLRGAFPVLRDESLMNAVFGTAALAGLVIAGVGRFRLGVVTGFVSVGLLALNALLSPPPTPIAWCEDGKTACFPSACQGTDLTVVDFTAEWCAACKEMEATVFVDERVLRETEGYGFIRVDEAFAPEVVDRFNVSGFPTVVFLGASCTEVHRFTSKRDAEGFLEELRTAKDKAGVR